MVKRVKGENEGKYNKGRRGLAEVVKLSDDKLRVDFEATEKEKEASFNVVVELGEDGTVPETFPFKKLKVNGKIKASVTMNEEGDRVLFAVPASGTFKAKFDKFVVASEGQKPAPETKQGKKAGTTYQVFAALLEIAEGNWKGAKYYHRFYFNFGKDEDNNLAVSGSGSGSDALYDFLEATGVNSHTIEFSENPLPEIESIAQEEEKVFDIIVVKGWVDMIVSALTDDSAFEEDYPETESLSEAQKDNVAVHPALEEE